MTSDQFRSSADRVGAMRELLQNPVLAEAIVCLKDERPSADAVDSADPVVSVRLLSRAFQHDLVIALFLSLAEPIPTEQDDPPETFGVDLSQFQTPAMP